MSRKNCIYNKNARWTLEDAIKFLQKPKGRIKRMRSCRKPRILHLEKRLGKIVYSWSHGNIFLPINRWHRH